MPRNLVLFDLEWNIGYQPFIFNYHGVQQTLRGEIIEIGAVKIDEDANVLDTFSIHLRPRIFRCLQHHIAKVTGLTQEDLAAYVDYPICKMLITLDPARRDEVLEAGRKQFAGEIDLYPSSPFFIEAVPLGVAKDVSLGSLLESRGLTRDNLMACGDGLNDRSMIRFAGVGVAMQNAEPPVKEAADYVTVADNNHDGVAEAIEKFIL